MLIRVALFLISHSMGFPIKTIFTQSGSWRINANFKLIKSLGFFFPKKRKRKKVIGSFLHKKIIIMMMMINDK